jgi:hypothetical protein
VGGSGLEEGVRGLGEETEATKRCHGRRGEQVRKPFPAAVPICRPGRGAARLGPTPGAAEQPLLGGHLGRHRGRRRRQRT